MKKKKISNAVIRRMPRYYRHLEALKGKKVARISSEGLAMRTGLTSSQIRQDFACFGEFGQQGYGYNVKELMGEIEEILGMTSGYTAVLAGAGRLGYALVANFPFWKYGINLTALYDVDPRLVGGNISGIPVYHISELAANLKRHPVDIGILTVPSEVASDVAEIFAERNVKGIWNFTNVELNLQKGAPIIENLHFFDSLFSLCCMLSLADEEKNYDYTDMKDAWAVMWNAQQRWNGYIKNFSKTNCVFTQEQVDALCGAAPMTQKVFGEVLEFCATLEDLDGYLAIWDSFPQVARCYAQRLDSEAE